MEIWKDVQGYETHYQVSNLGSVRSLDRVSYTARYPNGRRLKGKMLKPSKDGGGYKTHTLYINDTKRYFHVHRLVAETFIPQIKDAVQIDHINGIKTDNRACNLRWCSHKENHNFQLTIRKRKQNNENHPEWGIKGGAQSKLLFSKPIVQYDKYKVFIQRFSGVREAMRATEVQNISACLHGRHKLAGGYIWEFENTTPT